MKKLLLALLCAVATVGCVIPDTEDSSSPPPGYDSDGTFSSEVSSLALEIAWDDMTVEDQTDICIGWALDRERMLDSFMSGAGDTISRGEAAAFVDRVCG